MVTRGLCHSNPLSSLLASVFACCSILCYLRHSNYLVPFRGITATKAMQTPNHHDGLPLCSSPVGYALLLKVIVVVINSNIWKPRLQIAWMSIWSLQSYIRVSSLSGLCIILLLTFSKDPLRSTEVYKCHIGGITAAQVNALCKCMKSEEVYPGE